MKLTKSSEYAIRLICWLAVNSGKKYIPLSEIAEKLGLSFYQLTKVAQGLIRDGLINSYTGPNGGVELAKQPQDIALIDILKSNNEVEFVDRCILGLDECSGDNPCTMHKYWGDVRQNMLDMFDVNIAMLIEDSNGLNNVVEKV